MLEVTGLGEVLLPVEEELSAHDALLDESKHTEEEVLVKMNLVREEIVKVATILFAQPLLANRMQFN